LLQYSPNPDFIKGKDFFSISVYSDNNRLLKQDSVVIVVENNPSNLPCGVYPQFDYVYEVTKPTVFNVLSNDIICPTGKPVKVELYRPEANFPPYAGTAIVLPDNSIQYTPGSTFTGHDKLMYKVSVDGSAMNGIGVVHLTNEKRCDFSLVNDSYLFKSQQISGDTLKLYVFNNDKLCEKPLNEYSLQLGKQPQKGTVTYGPSSFNYILPIGYSKPFMDNFSYKVCYDNRCAEAMVEIKIE
jgi:hypothetical protein